MFVVRFTVAPNIYLYREQLSPFIDVQSKVEHGRRKKKEEGEDERRRISD